MSNYISSSDFALLVSSRCSNNSFFVRIQTFYQLGLALKALDFILHLVFTLSACAKEIATEVSFVCFCYDVISSSRSKMGPAALNNQRKSMANRVYTVASRYCLKSTQTNHTTAEQDWSVILGQARVRRKYQVVEEQEFPGWIIVF